MQVHVLCFLLCGLAVVSVLSQDKKPTPKTDLYPADGDVEILDSENFSEMVENSEKLWLVQFYAAWCPHSKRLVKEFLKAAREIKEKGLAEVGVINGSNNRHTKRKYNVNGYPTVMAFGKDKAHPTEYRGARQSPKIIDFILKEKEKFDHKL